MASGDPIERKVSAGRQENMPAPVQPQVKTDTVTSPAGFGEEYARAGLQPTILGQVGAVMAQSAGNALAEKRGYELGLHPVGDILPPLTNADKAYAAAYQTQSAATLGLQANYMFNKASEQMSQLNSITPGSVAEYTSNLKQGLEDIINAAPTAIKSGMINQYGTKLQNSVSHYNTAMIGQQKAQTKAAQIAFQQDQLNTIHDSYISGNAQGAESAYQKIINSNESNLQSGIYTPLQAKTSNAAAKQTYYSSKQIAEGLTARNEGKEAEFFNKLITEKDPALTWTEAEKVRNLTARYLNNVDAFAAKNQQLVTAKANHEIQLGTMNATKLAGLESQLDPLNFENVSTNFALAQNRAAAKTAVDDELIAGFDKTETFTGKSPKEINSAATKLVQSYMESAQAQGMPISLDEAKLQVAGTAAVAIPQYVQEMNNDMMSGNPELMTKAGQNINTLRKIGGQRTVGLTPQAVAIKANYEGLLSGGMNAQVAAEKAQEIVLNQPKEKIDINNHRLAQYRNDNFPNTVSLNHWANGIAGVNPRNVGDQARLSNDVQQMFSTNMMLTDGDAATSIKMVKDSLEQNWGMSSVNGYQQYSFLPVNTVMNLDEKATPLIQSDIYNQINPQIAETKSAFDEGKSRFYYELKPRMSFEDYAKTKLRLEEKGLQDPTYALDKQAISKYESNEPIEIERVFKNGHRQAFNINVTNQPWSQINPQTGAFSGSYDIGMVSKETGIPESMMGFYTESKTSPLYRPNTKWVTDRYKAVAGYESDSVHLDKLQKRLTDAEKAKKMFQEQTLPTLMAAF